MATTSNGTPAGTPEATTRAAMAAYNAALQREILPIPDITPVGLTTFDAKDPDTHYPPIIPLRLAAGGLRYTRFHTTALCSPTRSALLTGRNHHSVGMGNICELACSRSPSKA